MGETTLEEDDGNFPLPNSEVLNKAACDRIDQYTKTAGIAYNLLHTEMTVFFKGGTISSFNDKQVHNVLERSGVKKKTFDTVKGLKSSKHEPHDPCLPDNIVIFNLSFF